MKNSIRLDVERANDQLLSKQQQKKARVLSRKAPENGDAYNVVKQLGSTWSESKWGAETKSKNDKALISANVFKKSNNKYSTRITIDISSVSTEEVDNPYDCIQNIQRGIESVVDVCSSLSRKIAEKNNASKNLQNESTINEE